MAGSQMAHTVGPDWPRTADVEATEPGGAGRLVVWAGLGLLAWAPIVALVWWLGRGPRDPSLAAMLSIIALPVVTMAIAGWREARRARAVSRIAEDIEVGAAAPRRVYEPEVERGQRSA